MTEEKQSTTIQESELPKPSRLQNFKNKNLMTWLPMILLAIALPLTVIVARNQQSLRNFAATNETSSEISTINPTEKISTINPIEDAYVSSDLPKNNFGDSQRLYTKGPKKNISFLKFDLNPILGKAINKAVLRIKVYSSSSAASAAVQNVDEIDSLWSENSVNFNNISQLGTQVSTFSANKSASYFDIDLTSWVKSHAGNVSSLAIENTSTDDLIIYSKESITGKPTLTITYQ